MLERNQGCKFDLTWIENTYINKDAIDRRVEYLKTNRLLKAEYQAAWLLKALTCIDLTTLGGDDTTGNVSRLCHKATRPLSEDLCTFFGFDILAVNCPIKTAAVCVYPAKVADAVAALTKIGVQDKVNVAAVATGFPSGQYPLETRLAEIRYAVKMGAKEIDIVIDRSLVLTGCWEHLYQEIMLMKDACGPEAHLKAILAVGELDNMNNIFKASLVAMMAGSDFIKTSTGKETINATLAVGIVMSRAIKQYYERVGYKVGLKPAGGIRTSADALSWLVIVKEELDITWLTKDLFRFGASGLLGDIERQLYHFATCRYPAIHELTMC